ncbi:30S ribosomal protein S8 [bacterium]|nr:30S ribosomal protein S8 [bacterium]
MSSVTDTIADMFTRIRNALGEKHEEVNIPFSTIKGEIAKILLSEGYILGYEFVNEDLKKRLIKMELKYRPDGSSAINEIRRLSKSGKRKYYSKSQIPKTQQGFGTVILSTSKGLMAGRDARLNNVGGEALGEVS